jgi:vacuolar-type H+-ATPase subunit I/STV1
MLQRYIDDLKHSTGASLRMTSLVAIAGFAGFIALCFACAAIFIAVLQQHGAIAACLTIAGIFVVIAGIFALVYAQKQKRARERAAAAARAAARAAASAPLIDPMMVATGIQIARAVGLKKLVPLLALVGVAVGYMANRSANSAENDDNENGSPDEAAGD